jgi:hypothetical protein
MSMRALLASCLLLALALPAGAQTTVVSDNFLNTGVDEALDAQTNHSSTTGGNVCGTPCWSELIDSATTLQYNADNDDDVRASAGGTSHRLLWVANPISAFGSADYEVSLQFVQILTLQVDGDHFCVFGRLADATHGYGACVSGATAPQQVAIIEFDGSNSGLTPLISSTAFTVATNDIIKLRMAGNTLRMYGGASGTTELLCFEDSTPQTTAGQPGLGGGNFIDAVGDVSATWHGDNFLVVDRTGLGGDDNCAVASGPPAGSLGTVGAGK